MSFEELQNKLNDARDNLNVYFGELLGDTQFEILENREDNDIKLHIIDNMIGSEDIECITNNFTITYINVDGSNLELDLRRK